MNKKKTFLLVTLVCTAISLWALPTAVKNKAFYQGISYAWPYNAAPADQTTSNLSEIATDPDQIIAMLRTVYMNKSIPGNYVRGYDANGNNEGTWVNGVATGNYPVAYSAVGKIGLNSNHVYGYTDNYGWNLTGNVYAVNKSGSVTFLASQAADRTRTGFISRDGISVKMYSMYNSSSYYDGGNANQTITISAAGGRVITKVEMTFTASGYGSTYIETTQGTLTKPAGGTSATWTGSTSELVFTQISNPVRITKFVIYYDAPGLRLYDPSVAETTTVTLTPGTDYGESSGATNLKKGAFIVSYISNLGTYSSTWYLMGGSYDHRFRTADGYTLTNFKINCVSGYGPSSIDKIVYKDLSGNKVTINSSSTPAISDFINGLTFEWTIPTDSIGIHVVSSGNMRVSGMEVTYQYNGFDDLYFAPETYVPNEEGNTILMLEVADGFDIKKTTMNITDYASLRAFISSSIKSARILTDAKRVGENSTNPGTLLKIDCDKLNRFYLIGKGQIRWFNNDYYEGGVNANTPPRSQNQYTGNQPYYNVSAYYDLSIEPLFSHMFEQFSPTVATGGTAMNDIYRLLVNGQSFNVVHDCRDVLTAENTGHEFNMYGKTSLSEDCQDVRDMMFFVPDYRMQAFTNTTKAGESRDPNKAQRYIYYNTTHAPTVGLYVIKLDPITQVNKVENEAAYDVTLNWSSNLLKFLPGETGKYTLYRVTVDAGGTETYTALTEITTSDASELTYVDRVPQQSGSQVVTYAVRGQDQDGFLSLQMSNKENALIPGTDTSEQLQLELGADYYSRFDPQNVKNNYSNLIKLGNSQVTNIQASYLVVNTDQFTFTRSYYDENGHKVTVPFAVGRVISKNASSNSGNIRITLQNQDYFKYGYKSNGNSPSASNPNGNTFNKTYSFDETGVNLVNLAFYDNFSVSVADNNHPREYIYQVKFTYTDPETNEPCYALSNEMSVYVQKTDMSMANALTLEQVNGDTGRGLPAGSVDFDIQVRYSSKKDILRYDAYRWNEGETRYIIEPSSTATNEQDVAPNGIAGNQGDYYTIAMNTDNYLYTGETTVPIGGVANARFKDYYADANAGNYVYVPVVERFAPREDRTDYNTYGAPLRPAVTANVKLDVPEVNGQGQPNPVMSEDNWISGDKQYAYYTVLLDITSRGEGNEVLVPSDYQLYKVRVWRLVDDPDDVLGERLSNRLGRAVADYLVEELTYPDIQATTTGTLLGNSPTPFPNPRTGEVAATFGALDVKANQIDIPLKFIVRAYYTLTSNLTQPASGAPRREAVQVADDAKFYVVEREIDVLLDGTSQDPIVTAISGIVADRQVAGVTYYNLLGVPSARPTKGINVKVTRYTDGTFSTTKIVY